MTPEEVIANAWVQSWDQHIGQDGAIAVLNALDKAGLVIVPSEPTDVMNKAGNICCVDTCVDSEGVNRVWRAMVSEAAQR